MPIFPNWLAEQPAVEFPELHLCFILSKKFPYMEFSFYSEGQTYIYKIGVIRGKK